jgi:hypothetical protein
MARFGNVEAPYLRHMIAHFTEALTTLQRTTDCRCFSAIPQFKLSVCTIYKRAPASVGQVKVLTLVQIH